MEAFGHGFRVVGASADIARSDIDSFVVGVDAIPGAMNETHDPMVTLTNDAHLLAQAFRRAALEAIFLNAQLVSF